MDDAEESIGIGDSQQVVGKNLDCNNTLHVSRIRLWRAQRLVKFLTLELASDGAIGLLWRSSWLVLALAKQALLERRVEARKQAGALNFARLATLNVFLRLLGRHDLESVTVLVQER